MITYSCIIKLVLDIKLNILNTISQFSLKYLLIMVFGDQSMKKHGPRQKELFWILRGVLTKKESEHLQVYQFMIMILQPSLQLKLSLIQWIKLIWVISFWEQVLPLLMVETQKWMNVIFHINMLTQS